MCAALLSPSGGTPGVLSTRDEVEAAVEALAGGSGPLAVDTERASAYRYDDRAFLIQLRRAGAGTFLIDPETNRGAVAPLPGVLNDMTWVLHAASSDLPALTDLGLYPAELIDTELAGRLLGLPKVNLAAMTEELLGVSLAKGHGREDWSRRPLPGDWLDYAALDVELLVELADALVAALAELDRVEWLRQESEAVRTAFRPGAGGGLPTDRPADERWRSMKGYGRLRRTEQLAVGRALWLERDRIAKGRDVSPVMVLPHDVLATVAEKVPRGETELAAIRGFPRRRKGAAKHWDRVVRNALRAPRRDWPRPDRRDGPSRPHHRHWEERHPAAAVLYAALREAHELLAEDLGIAPETLLKPSDVREIAWVMSGEGAAPGDVPRTDGQVRALLEGLGARPWQVEMMAGLVAETVLLPRRQPLD